MLRGDTKGGRDLYSRRRRKYENGERENGDKEGEKIHIRALCLRSRKRYSTCTEMEERYMQ